MCLSGTSKISTKLQDSFPEDGKYLAETGRPHNSYCIPTIDVNKMDANNITAEDLTPYYVHHFRKLEKLIRKRAKARSSIKKYYLKLLVTNTKHY